MSVTILERCGPKVGSQRRSAKGAHPVSVSLGRRRVAPVAGVVLGVLTLGMGLASVPLARLAHQPGPSQPVSWLFTALALVPGVVVATVLVAHRPRNPIGWILLGFYLFTTSPVGDYAIIDYRLHHGSLPLGSVAVVLLASWPLWLLLIPIMLWVFPDGRLPPGPWRRVAVVVVSAGTLLAAMATAGGAARVAGHGVRIDAVGDLATKEFGWVSVAHNLVAFGVLASLLGWLAVQVPTYRRSAGERRQQFKWLYTGTTIFAVAVIISVLSNRDSSRLGLVGNDAIAPVGFAVLPVCIAVAVLKYRLYAIDRIISRVISYAIITAALAGVFAGLVLLATQVLPVKTTVAVAAATLAAAALFNPLRRRVQRAVDRRFNRARYNAEAVVAAFNARLRQTVDLDTVRDDLVGTVHQAFQPAHITVWLPGTGPHAPAPARASRHQPA
jgi:MFS family permease